MKALLKRSEHKTRWRRAVCLLAGFWISLPVLMLMNSRSEPEISGIPIAIVNSDVDPELSKLFLASFPNNKVVQIACADLDQAKTAMEREDALGIISIAENFSTALRYRFSETSDSHDSPIYIDIDSVNDNREIGLFLQRIIDRSSEVSITKSHGCVSAEEGNSVDRFAMACVPNKLIHSSDHGGSHFRHSGKSSVLGITQAHSQTRSLCVRDTQSLDEKEDHL